MKERQRRASGAATEPRRWRDMTAGEKSNVREYKRKWWSVSNAAIAMRQRRNEARRAARADPIRADEMRAIARQDARERRRRLALIRASSMVAEAASRGPDIDIIVMGVYDMAESEIGIPTTAVALDGADLSRVSTQDLRARLAAAITVSARGIYDTAVIFEELRRRGEPVDDLRLALAPYLPRIARGELAAEAVVALAGFTTALNRVALLPIDRQRTIIHDRIDVMTGEADGRPIVAARRIIEMSAKEISFVISDDGRVLEPIAQFERARLAPPKKAAGAERRAKPRGKQPRVTVDGGYVQVGRQAVRTEHLIDELRRLGVIQ